MNESVSPEFLFKRNYLEVFDSKMHYVDEGHRDPILFLHGNPTSSYLWRNIIPHLTSFGRCIAPDLIGMGKSDKPNIDYKFVDHSKYLEEFIKKLNLKNITLVIHDWGSILGFHYAMRHEDNVKGIAFMDAVLMPVPSWDMMPTQVKDTFKQFRTPDVGWDLIANKNFFIDQFLKNDPATRTLSDEEMKHYNAPFETPEHRKPLWVFPNQVPIEGEPADVTKAVSDYNKKLVESNLPKLLLYAEPGLIIQEPVVDWCVQNLKNLKSVFVGPGNHFVQEDHPRKIGLEIANWYKTL